ncbi:MAG: WbuC family cupin fold metalloprotein [Bacteroidaceae bacterium]|nr:WbuC family cupin fold metalloprotein [Bacteroidaceae bacterium]
MIEILEIKRTLLTGLTEQAKASPRLRQNYDLRTSAADTSQRMLNVLEVGTQVPIHRHEDTTETVICIEGRLVEIFYEEVVEYIRETTSRTEEVVRKCSFREVKRVELCPREGKYGVQIPQGVWHTVEVLEPSAIFEAKDGAYNG